MSRYRVHDDLSILTGITSRYLKQVKNDLQFLKYDIATVEKRQRGLLMSKDRHYKRVVMRSPISNLDSHPGCDSASTGGAVSVWRGGQGGAYAQPSEEELCKAERLSMRNLASGAVTKDVEKAGGSLENNQSVYSLGESAGVNKVTKKRRVLAQVYFVSFATYFKFLVITGVFECL
jgi:E3 ubiquitin-protein ligase RFWD2